MRVLCVGNMYPPHHLGGYELVWQGAVQGLRAAGHGARVLTTYVRCPGVDTAGEDDDEVFPELRSYWPGDAGALAGSLHDRLHLARIGNARWIVLRRGPDRLRLVRIGTAR